MGCGILQVYYQISHQLIFLDLREISVCTHHIVEYLVFPYEGAMGTNAQDSLRRLTNDP